ncbi:MAG: hypothetical protein C4303_10305 [candidate division GAL15 bacterium]
MRTTRATRNCAVRCRVRQPCACPTCSWTSSLARSEEAVRDLAASYRQAVLQLEADLSELVRRHDYRFRHEGLTPEQATSWLRALQAFHGRDPDEGRVEFRVRPGPLGSSLELG